MIALAGRSASRFGDEVALVALTLRLQASGARPYEVALLLAAGLVPFVVLARVAGRVADSADSRRVLVCATVAQGCCCIPLIFTGSVAVMTVLVALLGTGAAFSQATWQALIPRVVGEDNIAAATAAQQTTFTVASIIAPAVAGLLSGAFSTGVPLAVNAVTFGVLTVATMAVRTRRAGTAGAVTKRERGGWAVLRADRLLAPLVIGLAAFVLLAMMVNVVAVFLIRQTLHAGAEWYGVLEATWMLGVVVGSVASAKIGTDARRAQAVLAGAALMSLVFAGYGLAPAVAVLVPGEHRRRRGQRAGERLCRHARHDPQRRTGPGPGVGRARGCRERRRDCVPRGGRRLGGRPGSPADLPAGQRAGRRCHGGHCRAGHRARPGSRPLIFRWALNYPGSTLGARER